jgi:hypothetical protein
MNKITETQMRALMAIGLAASCGFATAALANPMTHRGLKLEDSSLPAKHAAKSQLHLAQTAPREEPPPTGGGNGGGK